jgi:hypothetical protein
MLNFRISLTIPEHSVELLDSFAAHFRKPMQRDFDFCLAMRFLPLIGSELSRYCAFAIRIPVARATHFRGERFGLLTCPAVICLLASNNMRFHSNSFGNPLKLMPLGEQRDKRQRLCLLGNYLAIACFASTRLCCRTNRSLTNAFAKVTFL